MRTYKQGFQFLIFLLSIVLLFGPLPIKAQVPSALNIGDPFSDWIPPGYGGSAGDFYCSYLGNVVKGLTSYYFWTACIIVQRATNLQVYFGVAQFTRSDATQEYVVTDSRRWYIPFDSTYLPLDNSNYFQPTFQACFPIPFEVLYQDGDNALWFISSPTGNKPVAWVNVYLQEGNDFSLHSQFYDEDPRGVTLFPTAFAVLYGASPINNDYTLYTTGTYPYLIGGDQVFIYKRWDYTVGSGWTNVADVQTDIIFTPNPCQFTKTIEPITQGIYIQTSAADGIISFWYASDNHLSTEYQSGSPSTVPDIIWSFGFGEFQNIVTPGIFSIFLMNNFEGTGSPYQYIDCTRYLNTTTSCSQSTMLSPNSTTPFVFPVPNGQLALCTSATTFNQPLVSVLGMEPSSSMNYIQVGQLGVGNTEFVFPELSGDTDANLGRMPSSYWLNTDFNRFIVGAPTAYQSVSAFGPGRIWHLATDGYCTPQPIYTVPVVTETSLVTQLPDPFVGYESGFRCYAQGTIVKAVRPLYFWTACVVVNESGNPFGIGVAQYTRPNTSTTFAVNLNLRFYVLFQQGFLFSGLYSAPNQDAAWPLLFHVSDNSQSSAWIYLASIAPGESGGDVGRIFVYQQQDNNTAELYDIVIPLNTDWLYFPLSLDWLDIQTNPTPNLIVYGATTSGFLRYQYIAWPGGIATVSGTVNTQDFNPVSSVGSLVQHRVYATSQAVYFRYSSALYVEWMYLGNASAYLTTTYLDPLSFPFLGENFVNFILHRKAPDVNFPDSQDNAFNGLFYTNQYQQNSAWNIVQQQGISPRILASFPPLGLDQTVDGFSSVPTVQLFEFGGAAPPDTITQILVTQPRLSPPQLQLLTMPILGSVPTLQTLYFPNLGSSGTAPWLGSMRTTSRLFVANDEIVIGAPNFNNGFGALFQIRLLNITVPPPVQPPVAVPSVPPIAPTPVCPPIPPIPPPIGPQATFTTFLGLPFAYRGEIDEFTRAIAATSDHRGIAAMGRAVYNNRSVVLTYYQPWNESLAYQLVGLGGNPPVGPVLGPITQNTTGSNWGTVRWSDDGQLLLIGAPVTNESIYVWQYDLASDAFHLQQLIETPPLYSTFSGGIGQAFDFSRDGYTLVYVIDADLHLLRWENLNTSSNVTFQDIQTLALPEQIDFLSLDGYGRCLLAAGTSNSPGTLYFMTASVGSGGFFSLSSSIPLPFTPSLITAVTLSANCSYFEVTAVDLTFYPTIISRRYTSNLVGGSWSTLVEQYPSAMSSLYLSDFGEWEASVPDTSPPRFVMSERGVGGVYTQIITVPDPTVNQTGAVAVQYIPITTRSGLSSDCRTLIAGHYKPDFPTVAHTGQGQIVIYTTPQPTVTCQTTPVLAPFTPPPPPPVAAPSSPPVSPPVMAPFLPPLFAPVLFPPQAPAVVILTPSQFVPITPLTPPTFVISTSPINLFVFYMFLAVLIAGVIFWLATIIIRASRGR